MAGQGAAKAAAQAEKMTGMPSLSSIAYGVMAEVRVRQDDHLFDLMQGQRLFFLPGP
jgi:hypothetical protein